MLYIIGMFSIGVFAITSVIATQNKNLDIFSVVFLGAVTALGGGTIRDIILGNYPIFWVNDLWFLWIAVATSLAAFFIVQTLSNRQLLLLYLDALGTSLFSIMATAKTMNLGFSPSIAILMGLITAIFGSILRDILTNSPSLLLRKELYATPILLGTIIYTLLQHWAPNLELNTIICISITFIFRAATIRFHLHYPSWLCSR
ncbi:MAG: trimeric intracellular cation channel family protein [Cellvibrionaceae bacterium]